MSGVHPYAIYYTIFESFNIDDWLIDWLVDFFYLQNTQ